MLRYEFTTPKKLSDYPKELINSLLHPTEEDDYCSLCERYDYVDVIDAMTSILSNGTGWDEEELGYYCWDYYLEQLLQDFDERRVKGRFENL